MACGLKPYVLFFTHRTFKLFFCTLPMPTYSPAQTLPWHIIEDIIQFVPFEHQKDIGPNGIPKIPHLKKAYLPYMSVCRSWRYAAGSIFYQSAMVRTSCLEPYGHSQEGILYLKDAIDFGVQHFIRDLYIDINIATLKQSWGSDEDDVFGVLMERCGELHRASSLKLSMTYYDRTTYKLPEEGEDEMNVALKNVESFIEKIKQNIPNICKVDIFKDPQYYFQSKDDTVSDFILDKLSMLANPNVCHISLIRIKVTKPILGCILANSLRSISLGYNKGNQKHIEIVRQNANTLESLSVDHLSTSSVLKLTVGQKGGYHTLVYPRLKYLKISGCIGLRNSRHQQPQVDPFPQLETLICRGRLPFTSPIVLVGGQSHIRHLDIDLDSDNIRVLMESGALKKGSYSNLQFVSFGWVNRSLFSRREVAQQLLTLTTQISTKTRIARINSLTVANFEECIPSIQAISGLKVLDMPNCAINIDEAIPLLSALSCLEKANFAFKDINGSEVLMPKVETIADYQERYKSFSTNAWALGISNALFANCRRAGEFLLLITSILSNIQRVSISINSSRSAYKILNGISYAKNRKIYKKHPVIDRVEFLASDFW
ncbi:hypothetical protein BX667DRAFT_239168 [Coemansia mojavensis]|nr:hypothetical protein BX667DRAFT_239168 [Coemansia mojavensis]